jgi:hypothetical protein
MMAGIAVLVFGVMVSAQVTTQQTAQQGPASQTVTVESGEVISVVGNDLYIRMADGHIRHFPNVPETATATVEGRTVTIRDVRPGMKLQRTITTSTAPRRVTTVRSVTGTVWEVIPPVTVVLTLDNHTNQRFTIPRGQKFMYEGRLLDAMSLRRGMKVSATAVTETTETVVEQQARVTGQMPPPPQPIPADLPVMVEAAPPTPVPAAAPAPEPTQVAQLPRTGSLIPLLGLLGLLSCGAAFALRALRQA